MKSIKKCIKVTAISLFIALAGVSVFSQKKDPAMDAKRVMWEPVIISERDVYWGPGGKEMQPVLANSKYLERQTGGNNLKHRIRDGAGRVWVAKIADESQPETAAVRLLWAIGYPTEINYLVPSMTIPGKGTYKNVRLEARPGNADRQGRWSWLDNPFSGTNELQGLKIMMALINNWDLKT